MHARALLIGILHVAVLQALLATCQTSSKDSASASGSTSAQVEVPQTAADDNHPPLTERERAMLQRIQQLEQRLSNLESQIGQKSPDTESVQTQPTEPDDGPKTISVAAKADANQATGPQTIATASKADANKATSQEEKGFWSTYTPNLGFKVANTEYGDLSVSIYTYARYLNQLLLDPTYTNAFGVTSPVVRRQDVQLLKLQMKFLGWVMNPKLRYFLYAWTSNANQGQGAQVVLAGNLNYEFAKYFTLGAGIYSLPGTRSVEGNFPFWLSVDSRLIADEFFRPSYTAGIVFKGQITDRLRYQTMIGDNLSILGVSALQLDNGFNTVANALVWTPVGDFGVGFGDFERHDKLAVRLAGHFTRSDETPQSQPNVETFENVQIRLADGTVIFTPNLFGPGIIVNKVTYKMAAFDTGLKYRGLSLDAEYFLRWLDHFQGPGAAALPTLFDQGYQLQASAMLIPKTLQAYVGGSTIHGKYGNPFDVRFGLNVFPFKNKVVRWNSEALYLNRSPVGYTSVPFSLGGTGFVVHTNWELAF